MEIKINNNDKTLKNGKSCGFDDILKEQIENTCEVLMLFYVKLFNTY